MLKIVECPRDAMQGIDPFIPTEIKTAYINQLLKVGFDTVDFGSFVSDKVIPQMRDTEQVLNGLDLSHSRSKLLVIVANERGAQEAVKFEAIDYLGFPFSISETFQKRNTNSTILESIERVKQIKKLCDASGKELVIYISMGFGNPYDEPWDAQVVVKWTEQLVDMGIQIIALSDTIGVATPESISYLFKNLIPRFPQVEFGAHLHTHPYSWKEKIDAAYDNGCLRFDSAIRGFGGCPMAKDDLVGNMSTENLTSYFHRELAQIDLDFEAFSDALRMTSQVFPSH